MAEPWRDPNAVLLALKAACAAHPDQRVTQVLGNALGEDPFYVEDREAAHALADYAVFADAFPRQRQHEDDRKGDR